MSLLENTQELLKARLASGDSLRKIAEESGGTVDRDWLTKFAAGKVADPGVNRVQRLHDCLKNTRSRSAA
jgi:hypothetical protein